MAASDNAEFTHGTHWSPAPSTLGSPSPRIKQIGEPGLPLPSHPLSTPPLIWLFTQVAGVFSVGAEEGNPVRTAVGIFEGTNRLGNNEGDPVVVFEGTSDVTTESEKLGNSVGEVGRVGVSVGARVGTAVGIADPVETSVGVTVTIDPAVGTKLGSSVGVAVAPASGIPAGCPVCTAVGKRMSLDAGWRARRTSN
jgi:hypothetical protein